MRDPAGGPAADDARFAADVAAALDGVPRDADGRAVWHALGKGGVLVGLYPPLGGAGPRLDRLDALITALDARHGVGAVLSVCVQLATALPILREAPGARPSQRAVEAAMRGDAVLALAVTDTAAPGSDLMGLGTVATLGDSTVRVDGGKAWITNACTADHALVLARHRPQRHFTSFVWVLVPTRAKGVRAEPAAGPLFAGAGLGTLWFDGVTVGRDHLLGSPGRGLATFARHVGTERVAGACWARALCRRVLAATMAWLRARTVDGTPLWEDAAVRARFARCLVELRRLDALCASSVAQADGLVASMLLKVATAESVELVLGECVQLHGADAFTGDGGGLAQLRAEAAMFGIAGGATGALLAGIAEHADELLGASS